MTKPKIAIVSLGGTIASSKKAGEEGLKPSLSGEDLVNNIEGIEEFAEIEIYSLLLKPSADLTFSDLNYAADKINKLLEGGIDGVVLTQGTDTLEETAYFLNLVVSSDKPVVITAAMRNPASLSPDGNLNILNAVLVAGNPDVKGMGTIVAMNGEIHLSTFVQKTNTQNVAAFKSPTLGPVGWITEGKVRIILKPLNARKCFPLSDDLEPTIPIVKSVLSDDGILIKALVNQKIHGLVLEATGGGHVSSAVADFAGDYSGTIPVVLCSRTGSGEILRRTYSFKGSEMDLIGRGVIRGGFLNSVKARILLYHLIKNHFDIEQIRTFFEQLS